VEADGARLVVVDELHPAGDAVLLVFEFAVTNLVGGDEDEWPCHENSLTRIDVLAMR
jgi:hypothetical protein